VLGAMIVAEIGDITRLPHPTQLCPCAGLTPWHREPDVKVNRGHITKQRSRILRWALIEAIQHAPAGHPLLAQGRLPRPPGQGSQEHRQSRHGPPAAHLDLLRDARRPGPCPGRRHRPGRVSRPGRGQRVIAGLLAPASGRPAACLIDPAARTRTAHAPAAASRGHPEGMNAAASLAKDTTRGRGDTHKPDSVSGPRHREPNGVPKSRPGSQRNGYYHPLTPARSFRDVKPSAQVRQPATPKLESRTAS
jgi:hypothetical protein